jgi:hypothetical protein
MLPEGKTDASTKNGSMTLIPYRKRFYEELIVAQIEPEGSVL